MRAGEGTRPNWLGKALNGYWFAIRVSSSSRQRLAETAGYVILSQLVAWVGENHFCWTNLYQVTQMEIGSSLRNTGCLLHGVSNDNDAILFAQLIDQVFYYCCGNRIQR